MKSPHSRYHALFLLYRLFQTTKIFYSPDDEIATAAAQFGEETQAGGGVVFNVKWRRYMHIGWVPREGHELEHPPGPLCELPCAGNDSIIGGG